MTEDIWDSGRGYQIWKEQRLITLDLQIILIEVGKQCTTLLDEVGRRYSNLNMNLLKSKVIRFEMKNTE